MIGFDLQGGSIAAELLKNPNEYNVRAVTRNKTSDKAKALAAAGAELVQADMNDLESLKFAVEGASVIFGLTDFISAGSAEIEIQHGTNLLNAALPLLIPLTHSSGVVYPMQEHKRFPMKMCSISIARTISQSS